MKKKQQEPAPYDPVKQRLYDYIYEKKKECAELARKYNDNIQFRAFKQWLREHKEEVRQYRNNELSEWDALRYKMIFRQEFYRYKSKGAHREYFEQIFEPYRKQWSDSYDNLDGIVTRPPIFWADRQDWD